MKNLLTILTHNLKILLSEYEAHLNAEPPFALVRKIENVRTAVDLTQQAIEGQLSETDLQSELARLNIDLPASQPNFANYRKLTGPALQDLNQAGALPPQFVRRAELGSLKQLLLSSNGQTPALVVLFGEAGTGKTGLVSALAQEPEIINHFKDGVLWATLGSQVTDGTVEAWQVAWGRTLGADLKPHPGLATKAFHLRKRLAGKKCLLIIDNARPEIDLTPLLVGGVPCCTLVTTRQAETARRYGATSFPVGPLSRAESIELLSNWAECDLSDEPRADELAERLGYLPLALTLAGAQLLAGTSLSELLAPLRARQEDLAKIDPGNPRTRAAGLQRIFEFAFNRLTPTEQHRYALLNVFVPGQPFDEAAVEAVWKTPPSSDLGDPKDIPATEDPAAGEENWESLAHQPSLATDDDLPDAQPLRTLTQGALVNQAPDPDAGGQYTLHPLLAELVHDRLTESERSAAAQRHADHYLRLASASSKDWSMIERAFPQIQAAWSRFQQVEEERAFRMVEAIRPFFDHFGLWLEKLSWHQTALSLARKWGNRQKEAVYLNSIGCVYYVLGRGEEALDHLQQALGIQQELGGGAGLAVVLDNIRRIYRERDDPDHEFEQHFQQALAIQRKLGDKAGLATLLNNIGQIYQDRANLDQALDRYRQALKLNQELGRKIQAAAGYENIGRIYQIQGELAPALHHYQQALDLNRELDHKLNIAASLWNVGDIYLKQMRFAEAEKVLEEAVALFEAESDPRANVARQWLEEARRGSRQSITAAQ